MAVVERTIIAGGGGDYTTIGAWEAATNLNSGADIWKGVISDNSAYNEAITINGGGSSTTSYVWLDVATANRHDGTGWDTGAARIDYTGSATAAIQVDSNFVRISGIQIRRSGASFGNSDEGIRVTAEDVLVESAILYADGTVLNTDAVYVTSTASVTIANTVAWGWGRIGVHIQSGGTHTVDLLHCTIVLNGASDSSSDQANIGFSNSTTGTITAYNCVLVGRLGTSVTEIQADGASTTTLAGSHNAITGNTGTYINSNIDTNTATDWVEASDGLVDTAPGTAGAYITETDVATFDPTPVAHANNVLIGAGTNRQGSEPDSRLDLSVDAAGNARPTTNVDLGAIQVSTGGGGPVPLTATGTAELTATAAAARSLALTATASAELTATANATRSTALAATATAELTATASATTATTVDLTATATAELTATASATRSLALAATGSAELTATAAATRSTALAAQASAELTTTASATTGIPLAATGTAELTTTAAATRAAALTATGNAELTATTNAARSLALTGTASAELTATAAATTATLLTATATAELTTTASAARSLALTATGTAELTTTTTATRAVALLATGTAELTATVNVTSDADITLHVTHTATLAPPRHTATLAPPRHTARLG